MATQSAGFPGPFCTPRVTVAPAATVSAAVLPFPVKLNAPPLVPAVTSWLLARIVAQFRHKRNSYGPAVVGMGNATVADVRSEERRVGKECRSRWSPYH